jgi:excisionase family DNA binding protein
MSGIKSDAALVEQLLTARASGKENDLNSAAWALVTHHARGIAMVARDTSYRVWGAETRADHLQECQLMAHSAIKRYDPAHGASVLTWVRRSLRAAGRSTAARNSAVGAGNYALRACNAIERARALGEVVDVASIAKRTGASEALVTAIATGSLATVSIDHDEAPTLPVASEDPADIVVALEAVQARAAEERVPTLTISQAARRLGVPRCELEASVASGDLRAHASGRVVAADVEALRQARRGPGLFG